MIGFDAENRGAWRPWMFKQTDAFAYDCNQNQWTLLFAQFSNISVIAHIPNTIARWRVFLMGTTLKSSRSNFSKWLQLRQLVQFKMRVTLNRSQRERDSSVTPLTSICRHRRSQLSELAYFTRRRRIRLVSLPSKKHRVRAEITTVSAA